MNFKNHSENDSRFVCITLHGFQHLLEFGIGECFCPFLENITFGFCQKNLIDRETQEENGLSLEFEDLVCLNHI